MGGNNNVFSHKKVDNVHLTAVIEEVFKLKEELNSIKRCICIQQNMTVLNECYKVIKVVI